MCKRGQILLLTKNNNTLIKNVENISLSHDFILTTSHRLSDVIDACSVEYYKILIIDCCHFNVDDDILTIFTRKNSYVANVIVISDHMFDSSVHVINPNDMVELEKTISLCEESSNNYDHHNNNIHSKKIISNLLLKLGFEKKYKGFNYVTDIIARLIGKTHVIYSFNKSIYPYIATLYNVKPPTIERDVRNLISKNTYRESFIQLFHKHQYTQPTTKNVIDFLCKLAIEQIY